MSNHPAHHAGERSFCPSPVFDDGGSCEFRSTWSVAFGQAAQVAGKAFQSLGLMQEQRSHVVMSPIKPDHIRDPAQWSSAEATLRKQPSWTGHPTPTLPEILVLVQRDEVVDIDWVMARRLHSEVASCFLRGKPSSIPFVVGAYGRDEFLFRLGADQDVVCEPGFETQGGHTMHPDPAPKIIMPPRQRHRSSVPEIESLDGRRPHPAETSSPRMCGSEAEQDVLVARNWNDDPGVQTSVGCPGIKQTL